MRRWVKQRESPPDADLWVSETLQDIHCQALEDMVGSSSNNITRDDCSTCSTSYLRNPAIYDNWTSPNLCELPLCNEPEILFHLKRRFLTNNPVSCLGSNNLVVIAAENVSENEVFNETVSNLNKRFNIEGGDEVSTKSRLKLTKMRILSADGGLKAPPTNTDTTFLNSTHSIVVIGDDMSNRNSIFNAVHMQLLSGPSAVDATILSAAMELIQLFTQQQSKLAMGSHVQVTELTFNNAGVAMAAGISLLLLFDYKQAVNSSLDIFNALRSFATSGAYKDPNSKFPAGFLSSLQLDILPPVSADDQTAQCFTLLVAAFDSLVKQFHQSVDTLNALLSLLAGILHLDCVRFNPTSDTTGEGCVIDSTTTQHVNIAANLVGISVDVLEQILTTRVVMVVKGEAIRKSLTVTQAQCMLETLVATIYRRVVEFVLSVVNERMNYAKQTKLHHGLHIECGLSETEGVDESPVSGSSVNIINMPPFTQCDSISVENSQQSHFSALMLNYCHEYLHYTLNVRAVEDYQLELDSEGVTLTHTIDTTYADPNGAVPSSVALLKEAGLLSNACYEYLSSTVFGTLDNVCKVLNSTDKHFLNKLFSKLIASLETNSSNSKNSGSSISSTTISTKYLSASLAQHSSGQFTVHHYGKQNVMYNVSEFVHKNSGYDLPFSVLEMLVTGSSNCILSSFTLSEYTTAEGSNKNVGGGISTPTTPRNGATTTNSVFGGNNGTDNVSSPLLLRRTSTSTTLSTTNSSNIKGLMCGDDLSPTGVAAAVAPFSPASATTPDRSTLVAFNGTAQGLDTQSMTTPNQRSGGDIKAGGLQRTPTRMSSFYQSSSGSSKSGAQSPLTPSRSFSVNNNSTNKMNHYSLSERFSSQFQVLMKKVQSSESVVRIICVTPCSTAALNNAPPAAHFDSQFVSQQLSRSGVFTQVALSRHVFPVWCQMAEFMGRYKRIVPHFTNSSGTDTMLSVRAQCVLLCAELMKSAVVENAPVAPHQAAPDKAPPLSNLIQQIGTTVVYLQMHEYILLEQMRMTAVVASVTDAMCTVQRRVLSHFLKRRYAKRVQALRAERAEQDRLAGVKRESSVLVVQCAVRCFIARRSVATLRQTLATVLSQHAPSLQRPTEQQKPLARDTPIDHQPPVDSNINSTASSRNASFHSQQPASVADSTHANNAVNLSYDAKVRLFQDLSGVLSLDVKNMFRCTVTDTKNTLESVTDDGNENEVAMDNNIDEEDDDEPDDEDDDGSFDVLRINISAVKRKLVLYQAEQHSVDGNNTLHDRLTTLLDGLDYGYNLMVAKKLLPTSMYDRLKYGCAACEVPVELRRHSAKTANKMVRTNNGAFRVIQGKVNNLKQIVLLLERQIHSAANASQSAMDLTRSQSIIETSQRTMRLCKVLCQYYTQYINDIVEHYGPTSQFFLDYETDLHDYIFHLACLMNFQQPMLDGDHHTYKETDFRATGDVDSGGHRDHNVSFISSYAAKSILARKDQEYRLPKPLKLFTLNNLSVATSTEAQCRVSVQQSVSCLSERTFVTPKVLLRIPSNPSDSQSPVKIYAASKLCDGGAICEVNSGKTASTVGTASNTTTPPESPRRDGTSESSGDSPAPMLNSSRRRNSYYSNSLKLSQVKRRSRADSCASDRDNVPPVSAMTLTDVLHSAAGVERLDSNALSALIVTSILLLSGDKEGFHHHNIKHSHSGLSSDCVLVRNGCQHTTVIGIALNALKNNRTNSHSPGNDLNVMYYLPQMDEPVDSALVSKLTNIKSANLQQSDNKTTTDISAKDCTDSASCALEIVIQWVHSLYIQNNFFETYTSIVGSKFTSDELRALTLPLSFPSVSSASNVTSDNANPNRNVSLLLTVFDRLKKLCNLVIDNNANNIATTHHMLLEALCAREAEFYFNRRSYAASTGISCGVVFNIDCEQGLSVSSVLERRTLDGTREVLVPVLVSKQCNAKAASSTVRVADTVPVSCLETANAVCSPGLSTAPTLTTKESQLSIGNSEVSYDSEDDDDDGDGDQEDSGNRVNSKSLHESESFYNPRFSFSLTPLRQVSKKFSVTGLSNGADAAAINDSRCRQDTNKTRLQQLQQQAQADDALLSFTMSHEELHEQQVKQYVSQKYGQLAKGGANTSIYSINGLKTAFGSDYSLQQQHDANASFMLNERLRMNDSFIDSIPRVDECPINPNTLTDHGVRETGDFVSSLPRLVDQSTAKQRLTKGVSFRFEKDEHNEEHTVTTQSVPPSTTGGHLPRMSSLPNNLSEAASTVEVAPTLPRVSSVDRFFHRNPIHRYFVNGILQPQCQYELWLNKVGSNTPGSNEQQLRDFIRENSPKTKVRKTGPTDAPSVIQCSTAEVRDLVPCDSKTCDAGGGGGDVGGDSGYDSAEIVPSCVPLLCIDSAQFIVSISAAVEAFLRTIDFSAHNCNLPPPPLQSLPHLVASYLTFLPTLHLLRVNEAQLDVIFGSYMESVVPTLQRGRSRSLSNGGTVRQLSGGSSALKQQHSQSLTNISNTLTETQQNNNPRARNLLVRKICITGWDAPTIASMRISRIVRRLIEYLNIEVLFVTPEGVEISAQKELCSKATNMNAGDAEDDNVQWIDQYKRILLEFNQYSQMLTTSEEKAVLRRIVEQSRTRVNVSKLHHTLRMKFVELILKYPQISEFAVYFVSRGVFNGVSRHLAVACLHHNMIESYTDLIEALVSEYPDMLVTAGDIDCEPNTSETPTLVTSTQDTRSNNTEDPLLCDYIQDLSDANSVKHKLLTYCINKSATLNACVGELSRKINAQSQSSGSNIEQDLPSQQSEHAVLLTSLAQYRPIVSTYSSKEVELIIRGASYNLAASDSELTTDAYRFDKYASDVTKETIMHRALQLTESRDDIHSDTFYLALDVLRDRIEHRYITRQEVETFLWTRRTGVTPSAASTHSAVTATDREVGESLWDIARRRDTVHALEELYRRWNGDKWLPSSVRWRGGTLMFALSTSSPAANHGTEKPAACKGTATATKERSEVEKDRKLKVLPAVVTMMSTDADHVTIDHESRIEVDKYCPVIATAGVTRTEVESAGLEVKPQKQASTAGTDAIINGQRSESRNNSNISSNYDNASWNGSANNSYIEGISVSVPSDKHTSISSYRVIMRRMASQISDSDSGYEST